METYSTDQAVKANASTVNPDLLLVSGSGRDRGKTVLICNIIQHWKGQYPLVAVKISAHNHEHRDAMRLLLSGNDFSIWEELTLTDKDSGRFLAAGAEKVYYIESNDENVSDAFHHLKQFILTNALIICESGSLGHYVNPGVMLFVQQKDEIISIEKAQLKKLSHKTIYTDSSEISFPAKFLAVKNVAWQIL